MVDNDCKIETECFNVLKRSQKELRADNYNTLQDGILASDGDPQSVGKQVILPPSFTGGPRYMQERQQVAMTYIRKYDQPDLFITFTCNPKWEEIVENLLPGQQSHDRPELTAHAFRLKLKC